MINENTPYVDRVLEKLMDDFDNDRIKPGEKVNALKISKELGISRGPVREAIAILSGQGVIELQKDVGATLKKLEAKDVVNVFNILMSVTELAMRLAAEANKTEQDIYEIRQSIDHIKQHAPHERSFKFYFCLHKFHYICHRLSENPLIDVAFHQMNARYMDRFLIEYIDLDVHYPTYIMTYSRMADAVIAGDADAAAAAARYHCRWTVAQIKKYQDTQENMLDA